MNRCVSPRRGGVAPAWAANNILIGPLDCRRCLCGGRLIVIALVWVWIGAANSIGIVLAIAARRGRRVALAPTTPFTVGIEHTCSRRLIFRSVPSSTFSWRSGIERPTTAQWLAGRPRWRAGVVGDKLQ
jgi:hypothetical protein